MTTVADLITLARERADMVNSGFISSAEAIRSVAFSYKALYDLLVKANEDYYLSSTTLTVSSGNSVSLPTDFYKLRGVDFYDGGRYHALDKFDWNERLHMEDDDLTGTYRLWYIPVASTITSTSTDISGINGWEEYIALDCAMKWKIKQEDDVSDLRNEFELIKMRIAEMALQRDASKSERIWDVYAHGSIDCRDIRYRVMGSSLYLHLNKNYGRY
jgi:hypothetical protein